MNQSVITTLEKSYKQWKKWRWALLVVWSVFLYLLYQYTVNTVFVDLPSADPKTNEIHLEFSKLAFSFGSLFGGVIVLMFSIGICWVQKGKLLNELKKQSNHEMKADEK